MSSDFKIDSRKLERALRRSPRVAGAKVSGTMDEIKQDWVKESRDVAPIDSGNLRRQLRGSKKGELLDTTVTVNGNAGTSIGSGFNYGLYIHEYNAGGKRVKGEKKYLDVPAEQNKDKWAKWLEDSIKRSLSDLWR